MIFLLNINVLEKDIHEKLRKIKNESVKRQRKQSDLIKWLLNFSALLAMVMGTYWLNSKTTGYFTFSGYNVLVGSIFGLLFLVYLLLNVRIKRL